MFRTSVPVTSGAAIMHQSEKVDLLMAALVKLPIPTSIISGSFQLLIRDKRNGPGLVHIAQHGTPLTGNVAGASAISFQPSRPQPRIILPPVTHAENKRMAVGTVGFHCTYRLRQGVPYFV